MSTRIDAPLFEATDDAVIIRPWETTLKLPPTTGVSARQELMGLDCRVGYSHVHGEDLGIVIAFPNDWVVVIDILPGQAVNCVAAYVSPSSSTQGQWEDDQCGGTISWPCEYGASAKHVHDHTTLLALIRDVAQREGER